MNTNHIKHHEHHATIDIDAATRGLLLRMGDDWLELGELFQAIDTYLKINEEYPGSEESEIAQSRLMTISRGYEKDGLLRLSLDVLERLEQTITTTA
jgi:hypothetical protein